MQPSQPTPNRTIALATSLLLAGFAIRLPALMRMPFQWLEAFNLTQAHLAASGRAFDRTVELKKWLSPPLLALFDPTGPEGPWVARFISVLLGVLSIAACIALGRRLGNRRIGLIAGLLYALLPLAVFHERQALADILLATAASLATLFITVMAYRPKPTTALLLAITLAAAYLTKVSALPYFLLPGWAILLLTRPAKWLRTGIAAFAGIILALVIVALPYARYVAVNPGIHSSVTDALMHQIAILTESSGSTPPLSEHLRQQLTDLYDILPHYLGWPLLAFTLIGIIVGLRTRWRTIVYLLAPAVIFIAPVVLSRSSESAARDPFLAARYILSNMVPLMVLTALALDALVQAARQRFNPTFTRTIAAVPIFLIIAPWLLFDLSLYGDPHRVRMTAVDELQYVSGQASGYGFAEASEYMLALAASDATPIHVLYRGEPTQIRANVGQRTHSVEKLLDGDDGQRIDMARWLIADEPILMFSGGSIFPIPDAPYGARLVMLASYPSAWGEMKLYQVVAAEGNLADQVYRTLSTDPAALAEDYTQIPTDAASILIFPPHHADALAEHIGQPVTPIAEPVWRANTPIDIDAAAASQPDDALLDVILGSEAATDPTRSIERALLDRWYRLEEAWAGSLHRIRYITASDAAPLPAIDGLFEGEIALLSGGTLDASPHPGDAIRIELTWRAGEHIRDSFKVFLHIAGADGTILTQSDSIPGAGLLPMTDWQPGQPVTDRFALRIPQNAAPGTYEMRVGIYFPESGLRLPVIDAAEHGGDYIVIGHIEITP